MSLSFSETDHERIRDAVRRAEEGTSGEIVAYLVGSSADLKVALLRAALFGATTAALAGLAAGLFTQGWRFGWLDTSPGIVFLAVAGGCLLSAMTAAIPGLSRFFSGRTMLERATLLQAHRAFVDEEVFATRDRTGILLFVSLMERRVEVIADAGISSVVDRTVWQEVVELIVSGIRNDTLTDGLVAGIDRCGAILHTHGIDVRPSDTNEIRDDLRVGRRL